MIANGIRKYQGRRVLMLQGPIGPFFYRLSQDLKMAGAEVFKINFNGGDEFFYPRNFTPFTGSFSEWPGFLENFIQKNKIEVILLFGDCRHIHRLACRTAKMMNVEVGVFEEGYMRPDYITLDEGGVNGHSKIPKNPEFYFNRPRQKISQTMRVGQTIVHSSVFSVLYFTAAILLKKRYPKYVHHRPLKFTEALPFIRSFFRKYLYGFTEAGIFEELIEKHSKKFYLLPLQVYNDSQIRVHSNYESNIHFIEEVISSFAENAPEDTLLVIKHHPMDRGHSNYKNLITELTNKYGIKKERWFYIHDQHLPTLLQHARGVVLVNSTVGMQALHHNCPMKVCGNAIYDMEGLTFQGELKDFWEAAPSFKVDRELYERYREYVINKTQLNGSIYKPLPVPGFSFAGLLWPDTSESAVGAGTAIKVEEAS